MYETEAVYRQICADAYHHLHKHHTNMQATNYTHNYISYPLTYIIHDMYDDNGKDLDINISTIDI